MKISIASGFFLPVPPVSGGSTEKSWYHLGREFAARGHEVTLFSRRWRSLPDTEVAEGIRHVRLPGHDHTRRLAWNLWLDFWWSWRVHRALPPADIAVVNSVALPIWLGRLKPAAGKVVIMTGRIPKGQYRHYRGVARVVAASTHVRDLVAAENPALGPVARVYGYPINWSLLSRQSSSLHPFAKAAAPGQLTIGYIGRIHEEKGLSLLAAALEILARRPGLPPWRVLLCGPVDIASGGSGGVFRAQLLHRLSAAVTADRIHLLDPQFNERALASVYRQIDVFCLPSLAEKGETFGVAAAEAMAAGAATVVSHLRCFADFVHHEKTGLVFDHRSAEPAAALAASLERLLRDADFRRQLAGAGQLAAQRYDYPAFAAALLDDFAGLAAGRPPRD